MSSSTEGHGRGDGRTRRNSRGARAAVIIWRGFVQLGYHLLYPLDGERFEQTLTDFVRLDRQATHYLEHGEFLPLDVEIDVRQPDEPMSIAELARKREADEDLPAGAEFTFSLHTREGEEE